MKHIKKIALLSLTALTLMSCNPQKQDTNTVNSIPGIDTVDTGSAQATNTEKKPTATAKDTATEPGKKPTTPDKPNPEPEETDPYKLGWKRSTVDLMLKYLGGNYLPLLKLGARKAPEAEVVSDKNERAYLTFPGDEYTDNNIRDAKNILSKNGYKIEVSGNRVTATHAEKHITVVLWKDSDYISMNAKYDEPTLDLTRSKYDSETQSALDQAFPNNPIPYVNLGSAYYGYRATSNNSVLNLYGGLFRKEMLSEFENTINASNTGVADEQKWILDKTDTTSANGGTYTATKTYENKNVVTLKISGVSATSYAHLTVSIKEGFNPDAASDWTQSTKSEIATRFNNNTIPFTYLGLANPAVSRSQYSYTMDITGGAWNDQVISLAKTAYDNANANATDGTTWQYQIGTANEAQEFVARKFNADGSTTDVLIYKSSKSASAKIELHAWYSDPVTYPTEKTDQAYDASVSKNIKTYIKYDAFPYVYLGESSLKTNSTWNQSQKTFTVKAKDGLYSASLYTKAKANLEAAGWTVSDTIASPSSSAGYDRLCLKADYQNTTTKDKYQATLLPSGTSLKYAHGNLKIVYDENYDFGKTHLADGTENKDKEGNVTAVTSWPSSLVEDFNELEGSDKGAIPFVYLGSRDPTWVKSTANGTETLVGNQWNDEIWDNFSAAFKNDTAVTWTEKTSGSKDDGSYTIVETGVNADEVTITVTLTKNRYGIAEVVVKYEEIFNIPTGEDAKWSDEIQTKLDAAFGTDTVLPYLYLAKKNPEYKEYLVTTNSRTKVTSTTGRPYVEFTGGTWNETCISNAKSVLTADTGWTFQEGEDRYDRPILLAMKDFTNGKTLRLKIFANGSMSYNSSKDTISYPKTRMDVYFDDVPKTAIDNTKTWSAKDKKTIEDNLGTGALPYIDLPSAKVTALSASSSYAGAVRITSTVTKETRNNHYITNAKTVLSNAGWTIDGFDILGTLSNTFGSYLRASKPCSDGGTLYLYLAPSGLTKYYLNVFKTTKFEPAEDEDAKYTDTQNKLMKSVYGIDIPYINIGADASFSFSSYSSKVTITGKAGTFSEDIFTSAESTLKADTANTWTITREQDYSSSEPSALVATTTTQEGKTVTIAITEYLGTNPETSTITTRRLAFQPRIYITVD